MKKISLCIFDLDGVIVDTVKYHYESWRQIAEELGFEFTEKHNERLKGLSRMDSLEIVLEVGGLHFDQAKKEELAAEKNRRYIDMVKKLTPDDILPGVKEFLIDVRNHGVKTALGSASKNAVTILNSLQITDLFDTIIDGTKVSRTKPDPEVFLNAAKELNVPPAECLVFEDSLAGIEAAKKGRMYAVAIGTPDKLKGYDIIIPGFEDINFEKIEELLVNA